MELDTEKVLVNNGRLAYSGKSKTAAVILAVMALVFSLVPRLAMHATVGSILVFAIIPGIAMLIFSCLLNKINPVLTGMPEAFLLLTDIIFSFIIYRQPMRGIELLVVWLPNLLYVIFYFFAFSSKESSRKVFRIITVLLLSFCVVSTICSQIEALRHGMPRTQLLFIPKTISSAILLIVLMFGYKGSSVTAKASSKTPDSSEMQYTYMFCPNCGTHFPAEKRFCDQCGTELKEAHSTRTFNTAEASSLDAPSGGFAVLGFFFPVVGLILYLVWHDTLPLRAKSAGKGALIGAIIAVVVPILLSVIFSVSIFSLL